MRVLAELNEELPNPDWVALVDENGLIVACIPEHPVIDQDRIAGMTAAAQIMADRVLEEIEGGGMRYVSIAGADRQLLTVVLSPDRMLALGLGPEVPAQATFAALTHRVPELLAVLRRSFVAD